MLEVFQYYMYNYMYMNDMQIELKHCYTYKELRQFSDRQEQRLTVEVSPEGEAVTATTQQDEAWPCTAAILLRRPLAVTAVQFPRQPATHAIAQQRFINVLQRRQRK